MCNIVDVSQKHMLLCEHKVPFLLSNEAHVVKQSQTKKTSRLTDVQI